MNKNEILLTFTENEKISKLINSINTSGTLNDKVKLYLNDKASKIIKYHNPNIDVNRKQSKFIAYSQYPGFYFMIAYTLTHSNHPYLIYFNLDDKYVNVLIPIGKDYQQININEYIDIIQTININPINNKTKKQYKYNINSPTILVLAIYSLLDETIIMRKTGLVDSKYSILTCDNMTLCINKATEINKMKISENEKQKLYKTIYDYYRKKGIELLQNYFKLLESKNYSEAYSFLKGGLVKFDKYYGKTRLNNFFKNNKTIIGHLEIFISFYEIIHSVRLKLLNY
jgi:hypothetical protein